MLVVSLELVGVFVFVPLPPSDEGLTTGITISTGLEIIVATGASGGRTTTLGFFGGALYEWP